VDMLRPATKSGRGSSTMVSYPHGPAGSSQRPGAPMTAVSVRPTPAPARRWMKWVVAVGGVVAVLAGAGGVSGLVATEVARRTDSAAPRTSGAVALQQWWLQAQPDLIDLQKASENVQHELNRFRPGALVMACQHVHDAAEVTLQSDLPSPSAVLTAELHAAIEDFHAAAHMCLSIAAGSLQSDGGEFQSSMAEANRHMRAAQDIIRKTPISV
jgi:hypothetical protein